MKPKEYMFRLLWLMLFVLAANGYVEAARLPWLWAVLIPVQLAVNILAGFTDRTILRRQWRVLNHGAECLMLFYISLIISVTYHAVAFFLPSCSLTTWIWSVAVSIASHVVLFWNGILCVYCTSVQLGIKWRVIGVLCGMIFPANLICLAVILRTVFAELRLETEKDRLNAARKHAEICKTKYPILLVHGVFFRDNPILNYWGRIPAELKRNGASVYYGRHSSALSVADSGNELAWRIKALAHRYGVEKVNIIAHSKGGLDCRYALMYEDVAPYVASLTTVNTPHRGSYFADHLLEKVPKKLQEKVEKTYNAAARAIGDDAPDFMAAARDLTAKTCSKTDKEWIMPDGIFCQSIGSVLKHARGGRFPLNVCYNTVKTIDGPNDGLVADGSFAFGEKHTLLVPTGRRGISHGDVIDLNRQNIPGFDVREFYVQLVHDLKERGL